MHSAEEMEELRADLFAECRSLAWRMERVREKVERVQRIAAEEQLLVAVKSRAGTRFREERIAAWRKYLRKLDRLAAEKPRRWVEVLTVYGS